MLRSCVVSCYEHWKLGSPSVSMELQLGSKVWGPICCFSHCCNKIPGKTPLKDRRVYFGSQLNYTQSFMVGRHGGRRGWRHLVSLHIQSGSRQRWLWGVRASSREHKVGHRAESLCERKGEWIRIPLFSSGVPYPMTYFYQRQYQYLEIETIN